LAPSISARETAAVGNAAGRYHGVGATPSATAGTSGSVPRALRAACFAALGDD
jgi:hypothetical protein